MAIAAAFVGGLFSFISPCVLPLVPSFIIYLTGVSLKDQQTHRLRAFLHALFFVLGFSLVFVALGAAASLFGQLFYLNRAVIRISGGLLIIFLGLFIMGALRLPFLNFERRLNLKNKPVGYFGSLLVGVTFSAAWTPCVGPILASVLALASAEKTVGAGVVLLSFYALGLGLPFLLSALALDLFLAWFKKLERLMAVVNFISGAFLIILGIWLLRGGF